jgi:hypothetical protein
MSNLKDFDPNSVLNTVRNLERKVEEIGQRNIKLDRVSELSDDLGDIRAGRFIAPYIGLEPTDSDFTGCFMSALGETFGGSEYHIGGVNAGALQFGLNADTGSALAGGGKVGINEDGIHIEEGTAGGQIGQYQPNGLTFLNSSADPVGELYAYLSGSTGYRYLQLKVENATDGSKKGVIDLTVEDSTGTELSRVLIDGVTGLDNYDGLWPDGNTLFFNTFKLYDSGAALKAMTRYANSTIFQCGQRALQASAANGDYFINHMPIKAGTYKLGFLYEKNSSCGKFDIYIDGTIITVSPVDAYAASSAVDTYTQTGITIAKNGAHEIKILVNGKHTSSSGYSVMGSLVYMAQDS